MARLKFPRPPSLMERNALRADDVSWLLRFAWLPSALCFECTKTVGKETSQIYSRISWSQSTHQPTKKAKVKKRKKTIRFFDRRLDTSWCLCEQCTIMPTEVESISCKEPPFLSKMVEGIV